jgi:hypothetical protein
MLTDDHLSAAPSRTGRLRACPAGWMRPEAGLGYELNRLPGCAPSREEFEGCQQFVFTIALRAAQLSARAAQPSWQPSPAAA